MLSCTYLRAWCFVYGAQCSTVVDNEATALRVVLVEGNRAYLVAVEADAVFSWVFDPRIHHSIYICNRLWTKRRGKKM